MVVHGEPGIGVTADLLLADCEMLLARARVAKEAPGSPRLSGSRPTKASVRLPWARSRSEAGDSSRP